MSPPSTLEKSGSCGDATEKIEIEYPVGHRRRRGEAIPLLERKYFTNLHSRLSIKRAEAVKELCSDWGRLEMPPIQEFVEMFVI